MQHLRSFLWFCIPESWSYESIGPAQLQRHWDIQYVKAQNATLSAPTIKAKTTQNCILTIKNIGKSHIKVKDWKYVNTLRYISTGKSYVLFLHHLLLNFSFHPLILHSHLCISHCFTSLLRHLFLLAIFLQHPFLSPMPVSVSLCLLAPILRSWCCLYSWQLYLRLSL